MTEWRPIIRPNRDILGEGALWSVRDHAFYWVDILAPALNRFMPADGRVERWPMPEPIGWVVERRQGGFVCGLRSGFAELELSPLKVDVIVTPEPELPGNRMNDGKADQQGAIWCGTMSMDGDKDTGSFWRFGLDRQPQRIDTGYRITNGPAFSSDGKWIYHSDTGRRTVYRFPILENGELGARETFIVFEEEDGFPDGMTTDIDDHVWIAHWGAGKVSRFRPDGSLDRSLRLPATQITNVAFGGDAFDRLYVTSAALGLPDNEFDGALFEILDPGAVGLPAGQYFG